MTGFAAREGAAGDMTWSWELRSVNARGLDLRLRLPEKAAGIEKAVRERLQGRLARGSVTVGLRLREEAGGRAAALDLDALEQAVMAIMRAEETARGAGLEMRPMSAAELMALPGVYEPGTQEAAPADAEALLAGFDALLAEFEEMRGKEGAALARILSEQIDTVESLVTRAEALASARAGALDARLREGIARLMEAVGQPLDEARLAQEIAALHVKGDVTEEIDRLRAHVEAARGHLKAKGPVGRKLDFLMQEFNREANTLCSKSADTALTEVGLELKLVIDRMREQVQNIE